MNMSSTAASSNDTSKHSLPKGASMTNAMLQTSRVKTMHQIVARVRLHGLTCSACAVISVTPGVVGTAVSVDEDLDPRPVIRVVQPEVHLEVTLTPFVVPRVRDA